jgi:hypothetical protein
VAIGSHVGARVPRKQIVHLAPRVVLVEMLEQVLPPVHVRTVPDARATLGLKKGMNHVGENKCCSPRGRSRDIRFRPYSGTYHAEARSAEGFASDCRSALPTISHGLMGALSRKLIHEQERKPQGAAAIVDTSGAMARVSELSQFCGAEAAHEPEYNKFEDTRVIRRLFMN